MNNLQHHHQHMVGHMSNSRQARKDRRRRATVKARTTTPKPAATITVRCDARTTITCKPSMLAFWQARYPNLTLIQ